jgi:hypothetical protein
LTAVAITGRITLPDIAERDKPAMLARRETPRDLCLAEKACGPSLEDGIVELQTNTTERGSTNMEHCTTKKINRLPATRVSIA